MNENEQNNPYNSLTSPQQIAIDLRLAGKAYKDIAPHMSNLQEHTLRTWFMNGGVCYEAYEWKKKLRAEEREQYYRDEIENVIKDLGRYALVALQEAVSKGNITAIVKALELSGISKLSYQIDVKQDEGILILREIITEMRAEAKAERELKNDQTQNDQTQIVLRAL